MYSKEPLSLLRVTSVIFQQGFTYAVELSIWAIAGLAAVGLFVVQVIRKVSNKARRRKMKKDPRNPNK